MPKLTKNHTLPPSQHGTPEAIPSQSDTTEAAAKDRAQKAKLRPPHPRTRSCGEKSS